MESMYVVEQYYAYESGDVVGVYTDLLLAIEKVLKVTEGKDFHRVSLSYTWADSYNDKHYIITEVAVNQDIKVD